MQEIANYKVTVPLAAETHTAGVGIVGSTHGNRKHAGACRGHLVLGGGRGGLGGGSYTGEDEDGDESADDVFHGMAPFSCFSVSY